MFVNLARGCRGWKSSYNFPAGRTLVSNGVSPRLNCFHRKNLAKIETKCRQRPKEGSKPSPSWNASITYIYHIGLLLGSRDDLPLQYVPPCRLPDPPPFSSPSLGIWSSFRRKWYMEGKRITPGTETNASVKEISRDLPDEIDNRRTDRAFERYYF